jgi:hypothetical protein
VAVKHLLVDPIACDGPAHLERLARKAVAACPVLALKLVDRTS